MASMDISCSWIGITNIIKVAVPPKLIYKFNIFSIKISAELFRILKDDAIKVLHSVY